MITDIMEEFDFAKVHTVMLAIDWKWTTGKDDEMVVPGMWRIMDKAKSLLEDVMKYYGDGNFHFVSSCGFTASLDNDSNLTLQFILEEMSSQPDYGYDDL